MTHAMRRHLRRRAAPDDLPELRLRPAKTAASRAGHLWIFSNEVDTARTPLTAFEPGRPCRVDRRPRPLPRLRLRQSARADLRADPRPRSGASCPASRCSCTGCRWRSRCASGCTRAVLPARLRRIRRTAGARARPLRRRDRRPDRHGRHGGAQGRDRRGGREGGRAAHRRSGRTIPARASSKGSPSYVETALGRGRGPRDRGRGERRALQGAARHRAEDRLVLRPGVRIVARCSSTSAGAGCSTCSATSAPGASPRRRRAPAKCPASIRRRPRSSCSQSSRRPTDSRGAHGARRRLRCAGSAARRRARNSTWSSSIRRRSSSAARTCRRGRPPIAS